MYSTEELLRKAVLSIGDGVGSGDFGGTGQASLTIEQVRQFLTLLAASQVMLNDVRTVSHASAKWEQSILNFGSRIARPGVEGERLSSGNRVKPSTTKVQLDTELIRGEVDVTDEVMEDNVEGSGFANTLETAIVDRFGFDIEELMVNGDTTSGDTYLAVLDGWLEQAQDSGHATDGTTYGQNYQEIFRVLLNSIPDRYKRNMADWRYYVPMRSEEKFRDILADRGTGAGDMFLLTDKAITYQGIPVLGVPSFAVTSGTPDKSSFLLANKNNLLAGFHRKLKFEPWRDPREGTTFFTISARVDAKIAVADAVAVAYDVDVEAS